MKGSEFAIDYVHLIYYVNPNRGGSYINSHNWKKNKIATINPINKKDNKCFQYAVTVTLNHKEITKYLKESQKLFINKYKWEGINFPSEKDGWKKIEKNNVTIALKVLYVKKSKNISYLICGKITIIFD